MWRLHRTQGCCLCKGRLDTAQMLLPVTWMYLTFPFRTDYILFSLYGSTMCLTPSDASIWLLAVSTSTDPGAAEDLKVQVDFKSFTLLN